MKRVVIYARVSTEEQGEHGTSLESQVDRSRAYAGKQDNWHVIDVITEQYSGFKLAEREGLQKIRDRARRHEFDILLCYDLDRLSREQNHCAILFYEMDKAGVDIRFVLENFENTPTGKFLRNTRTFIAEFEREKIRERTSRGILQQATRGKPNWGRNPPYGYQFADDTKRTLVEEPVSAAVLQRIRRELLADRSISSLAQQLTDERVPTPAQHAGKRSSGVWQVSTIRALLQNPIYTTGSFHQFMYSGRQGAKAIQSKVLIIPNVAPPLWSEADLTKILALIASHRNSSTRNNKNPQATLLRGGYVRCAHCGRVLGVHSGTKDGRPCYFVNARVRKNFGCDAGWIEAKVIDTYVWSRITRIIENPALIREAVEYHRQQLKADTTLQDELEATTAVLTQLNGERQNLLKLTRMLGSDDEEALAPIAVELQQLRKREQGLEKEQGRLQALLAAKEEADAQVTEFIDWCGRTRENLSSLGYEDKRRILAALDVTVYVAPSSVTPMSERFRLEWSLPLSLNEITDTSPSTSVGNLAPIRLVWQEPLELAAD